MKNLQGTIAKTTDKHNITGLVKITKHTPKTITAITSNNNVCVFKLKEDGKWAQYFSKEQLNRNVNAYLGQSFITMFNLDIKL